MMREGCANKITAERIEYRSMKYPTLRCVVIDHKYGINIDCRHYLALLVGSALTGAKSTVYNLNR
jgi:hypothetical protein